MALEFKSSLASLERERDAKEAASAGLECMRRLMHLLSHRHNSPLQQQKATLHEACSSAEDATISEFKKVCSLLSRSGHARFRRCPGGQLDHVSEAAVLEGPASCSASELDSNKGSYSSCMCVPPMLTAAIIQQGAYKMNAIPKAIPIKNDQRCILPQNSVYSSNLATPVLNMSLHGPSVVLPPQRGKNKILAISGERAAQGHVHVETSYGKNGDTYPVLAYHEMSYGKRATKHSLSEHSMSCTPPLSTTATGSFMSSLCVDGSVSKDKNSVLRQSFGGGGWPPLSVSEKKCSGDKLDKPGGKCHISKRRKQRIGRIVRVLAISTKMADIPPDGFSWRKYGEKSIKGSPHPRGYYRCSIMREGCLATKHVERALDEPNMLIVTYGGEHNHGQMIHDNTGVRESAQV